MATTSPRGTADSVAARSAPHPHTLPPLVAAGLVFVASGAVLVLEILAVRLLAPYVGLTLETTTSIIGAVLAGISLGAAIGGRLADRGRDARLLVVRLLVLGGALALLTVPIVRALGPGIRGKGNLAALAVTVLALVPAAGVLSAVSPTVARLQLHDLRASGTIVGKLSAWATAGALVGTFGTGFVLVPLMPVSDAVFVTGGLLVLAGLVLGGWTKLVGATAIAALAVGTAALGATTVAVHSPCDLESSYHCAKVQVDPARPTGRTLVLDDSAHSYVDVKDPSYIGFGYIQWIADGIDAVAGPRRPLHAVIVGGGGFTMPRWIVATHPGSQTDTLEVDGDLVELARKRLALRTSPALRVHVGDGRMTMRKQPTDSADVVVGDAFGKYTVPWHLTTVEWNREVKRVLAPGGLYAFNIIDMRPLKLLKAEIRTLLDVFADVRMIADPGVDEQPAGGNAVLLASDRRMPPRTGSRASGAVTYDRAALARLADGAKPLTDDHAPVDQLITVPD